MGYRSPFGLLMPPVYEYLITIDEEVLELLEIRRVN
jgi:hypothetical protein